MDEIQNSAFVLLKALIENWIPNRCLSLIRADEKNKS
jgi:hypothetical protein